MVSSPNAVSRGLFGAWHAAFRHPLGRPFSDYIGRAYETTLWPLLGFFFMPLTTLSYAFAMNSNGAIDGMYLVLVVVTVLLDLGLVGAGSKTKWRD